MQAKAKTRKIIKLGDSFAVTLPSDFVKRSRLTKGDTVAVAYDDLLVIVNPNLPRGEPKHEPKPS